ncbi:MAG: hypothetical protein MJZ57_04365, partial [Bacteroidales bacterium]|nr:hypothetical protein [Bacteroidales bacterium]
PNTTEPLHPKGLFFCPGHRSEYASSNAATGNLLRRNPLLSPQLAVSCPEGARQRLQHIYERASGWTGNFIWMQI